MDIKFIARLGAVVIIAASLIVALRSANDRHQPVITKALVALPVKPDNRAALDRCLSLGNEALHDSHCIEIWAANRRRFLNLDQASTNPQAPASLQSPAPILFPNPLNARP